MFTLMDPVTFKRDDDIIEFNTNNTNYFGSIDTNNADGPNTWNGDPPSSKNQNPLGTLTRKGNCWVNDHARICIEEGKASEIDDLPGCEEVSKTVEKILQKRTDDATRWITYSKVVNETANKRMCVGQFAEDVAGTRLTLVKYDITRLETGGYSVSIQKH